jgi:hypothetical protein
VKIFTKAVKLTRVARWLIFQPNIPVWEGLAMEDFGILYQEKSGNPAPN